MKFKILEQPTEKVLHRFTVAGPDEAYKYLDRWVRKNLKRFTTPKTFSVAFDQLKENFKL